MSCCVPGCANLHPQWTAELPRDDEDLQERWMQAIQAGTGHRLPYGTSASPYDVPPLLVCNVHFELHQSSAEADESRYQEPTLFNRDNIVLQVASCSLCLRYDAIDNMFDGGSCLANGISLQWMTQRYFKIPEVRTKQGFFCESCTVRLDMTHNFNQDFNANYKLHLRLLHKMATKKRILKNNNSVKHEEMKPSGSFSQFNDFNTLGQDLGSTQTATYSFETPKVMSVEKPKISNLVPTISEKSAVAHSTSQIKQRKTEQYAVPGFKCHICNTEYDTRKILAQHLLIDHPAQEIYYCETCKLPYESIEVFNFHLDAHANGRILKCEHCPMTFRTRGDKLIHQSKQHGIDLSYATDPNVQALFHKCLVCDKKFSRKRK